MSPAASRIPTCMTEACHPHEITVSASTALPNLHAKLTY
jgi:hypothetical protein